MAWAYVQTVPGMGREQYEAVTRELRERRGGDDPPEGAIIHAAGIVDGGLRVIEVWESEDDYRRFREEHLAPAIRAALGDDAVVPDWPPPGMEPMETLELLRGS